MAYSSLSAQQRAFEQDFDPFGDTAPVVTRLGAPTFGGMPPPSITPSLLYGEEKKRKRRASPPPGTFRGFGHEPVPRNAEGQKLTNKWGVPFTAKQLAAHKAASQRSRAVFAEMQRNGWVPGSKIGKEAFQSKFRNAVQAVYKKPIKPKKPPSAMSQINKMKKYHARQALSIVSDVARGRPVAPMHAAEVAENVRTFMGRKDPWRIKDEAIKGSAAFKPDYFTKKGKLRPKTAKMMDEPRQLPPASAYAQYRPSY